MEYITTITKKGQLTIPKEVREFLAIFRPGKVVLDLDKDKAKITLKQFNFLDLAGKFKPKGKKQDPVKLREQMASNYQRI